MTLSSFLRPTRKKAAIIAVVAVTLILGIFFFSKPKQQTMQFATVKRQDIKSTVSSSGSLTGQTVVNLRFKGGGKLAFINVKVGNQVASGQTIAGLDPDSLGVTLQQAQNTLRDKQATIDKVLDDIHLFQYGNGGFPNVGSANETMTQRQLRTTAEVARDNAFDSIKAAQIAFSDTIITTPISGLVTQAVSTSGVIVSGSDTIAQVVDNSEVVFQTDVDEADISAVLEGQRADITLDAYPGKTFKGEVIEIEPQVKTTSSGANVVTVKIQMGGAVRFINGLSGEASIITAEKTKALTIPQEALRDDDTVVIRENNTFKEQKVVPGVKSDTDVEIESELKEGDRVLLNPPAPGTRIQQSRSNNPLGGILRMIGIGPRGGQARFR